MTEIPEKPLGHKDIKNKLIYMLYYISAFLLPSVFLFDMYNRNRAANILFFNHILILAGILGISGLLLFIALRFAVSSMDGAVLLSLLFWLYFWFFEWIYAFVTHITGSFRRFIFLVILIFTIALIGFLFRRFKPPFHKIKPVFVTIAACLIMLFLFNLFFGVSHQITLRTARQDQADTTLIMEDFVINPNLPTPDIYWLHIDGIMGTDIYIEHFDLDLNHFRDELEQLGFIIYDGAFLSAGYTNAAMAALFSPGFYDNFLGELLERYHHFHVAETITALDIALAGVGLTFYEDIVHNFELINAFTRRGYSVYSTTNETFPFTIEQERFIFGHWPSSQFGNLPELLEISTPFNMNIFSSAAYDVSDNLLYDIMNQTHNKFIIKTYYDAHLGYIHRNYLVPQFGDHIHDDHRPDVQLTLLNTHLSKVYYTFELLLSDIDLILSINPDAVIIIQSDHGPDYYPMDQLFTERGFSPEQWLEYSYSLFSAVRIPPELSQPEEPIAPLNIARELVNRFVGENYDLLQ